ncbi:outer dense fiber protein 3-like isoform X2 [Haliotis rufescens]|uniref:outer dense fiber protein 3-like isoform X2 n=1 Tax=Haliotis rufescens TaxID=6454 RepID=UPI00201F7EBA|nr:outer dense fiber protein 3-like isoform X2 [Haliotis rufescens]
MGSFNVETRTPSPCTYRPIAPSKRDPGPSYSMSTHLLKRSDAMPGPSAYSPAAPWERDPGPSYSLGSRPRDLSVMRTPGPSGYRPSSPSSLHPGPKFSITSRHMPSRFATTVEEE